MTPQEAAAVTLAVLLVVGLALTVATVPLRRPPAPRPDQLAALADLPPDEVGRARAFRRALRPATYGSLAVGLVAALLLGLTPLGASLVAAVGRPFGGNWAAQALLGGLAVGLVLQVVTLPFAAWRHVLVVRYGLSTQGWAGWAVDVVKSVGVALVIAAIALLGFFGIAHLAPAWWWAWSALGAAVLVGLLSFVLPVLVEPIFNRFTPMPDGPLRNTLLALAARDGVPVRDVLVADASRRTRAVNAYVSGYGPTRRIVVYDTLLHEAPAEEVASVVAHELGHARRNDVLTGTLLGAVGSAAGVVLIYLAGHWTTLLRAAGVNDVGQPPAIALLLALAAVAGLVTGPVQALVSRHVEARADAHALRLTGDPATFAVMQRRLATVNLADPDPPRWEYVLWASHPSSVERIAAARAYARESR